MVDFPKRLYVGRTDAKIEYELTEDQLLIRVAHDADEQDLLTFLCGEGLETFDPPPHIQRCEPTLASSRLRWITLRQRFSSMKSVNTLLKERKDIVEVCPIYYQAGYGKETAATPMFDTLIIQITTDRHEDIIAALSKMGLKHNDRMSSLLSPYHFFSITPIEGKTTGEQGLDIAKKAATLDGVMSVEFDWLKLETYQVVPNDPLYTNQWNMKRIAAETAWNTEQGNSDVWIAIIDSGFDLNHPDLSFTPNSVGNYTHFNADQFIAGDPPPYDASSSGIFHGTAVAGISGAVINNNQGVAGVAGRCRIMPVRLGTSPTAARVAAGINWAANNGARVANLSLTTPSTADAINAVENAWAAGMVLCAANGNSAGNANSPPIGFPANHPNTIAVGASDLDNTRKRPASSDGECWGSQYGNEIDVVAPGVNIWTTDEQGTNGYNNNGGPINWACVNYSSSGDASGNYVSVFNGTSSATPHVTGLAALLFSVNPSLNNQNVRDIIASTTDKVSPSLYPYTTVAGRPNGTWHQEMGYGLINSSKAVVLGLARLLLSVDVI